MTSWPPPCDITRVWWPLTGQPFTKWASRIVKTLLWKTRIDIYIDGYTTLWNGTRQIAQPQIGAKIVSNNFLTAGLLCKDKRQYLFTCKLSRYCFLALHDSAFKSSGDRNRIPYLPSQREPMLMWCWASVGDGGRILHQHWSNISCLFGVISKLF